LETTINLLKSLEGLFKHFSKYALKSLNNQTDFDSAIRRFDPSRPSHSLSNQIKRFLNVARFSFRMVITRPFRMDVLWLFDPG